MEVDPVQLRPRAKRKGRFVALPFLQALLGMQFVDEVENLNAQLAAHTPPQHRFSAIIVGEARKGRSVVRMKFGDPGITAAYAARAAPCQRQTEHGQSGTLILAIGTGCANDPFSDYTRFEGPDTTPAR